MNPNDVVVRIERAAGNFSPKVRERVLAEVTDGFAAVIANAPTKETSVPLTDAEISLVRASLRKSTKK